MSRQLPERANLEHLREEAKALHRSLLDADAAALERAQPFGLPPFKLSHAQLVLAREYGFESWPKLKRFIEGASDRRVAFFAAVRAGDRETAQSLLLEDRSLAQSLDPNSFDAPALNLAASRNDLPMIDLLLDHGAAPNAKSRWWAGGFCPLDFADERTSLHLMKRGARLTAHAAARLGLAEQLRKLVAADPGIVHERGGDGQMPLHFAKTAEIVDILLDAGADIEARDVDHEGTPAQHAVLNEPVLQRLLERGAKPDIFIAVIREDTPLLEQLLAEDPNALERQTGEPGNPQIPTAPGAHIYTYSLGFSRPDQVAVRFGKQRSLETLYSHATARQKLLISFWQGNRDGVRELLEDSPDTLAQLSIEDRKMLPKAAWERNLAAVRLMLEHGFDPNLKGPEESTAVDRAAFHGFDDIIESILPYNPDLTVRNVYGGTPLGACIYGSVHGWRKDGDYVRSVKLLMDAGSPLPSQLYGSEPVRDLLLQYGVR